MDNAFETKIRERAYALWLAEGMRDGAAEGDWLRAENIVRKETEMPARTASATAKGAEKPAEPRAAKKGVGGPVNSKSDASSAKTSTAKTSTAKTRIAKKAAAATSPEVAAPRRAKSVAAGIAGATA